MTELWLLEDLEPFPDAPGVGDVFTPTTYWVDSETYILAEQTPPSAICSTTTARVVRAQAIGSHEEWTAEVGNGFLTMLPGDRSPGVSTLRGCLMWDRYLWLDYRTELTGRLRLIDRPGHVVQRRNHTPTNYPGWFAVHYIGAAFYAPTGTIPDGHDIRFNVLRVSTD